MRLRVLGCAGSYPSAESAASSYLVQAEDADGRTWSVVLDLGNGALGPLQRWGDPTTLDAVAISHLHADHAADLLVLNVLRRYRPDGPLPPLPLHAPADAGEWLALLADKDPGVDATGQLVLQPWEAGVPVTIGPFTVVAVPVLHPVPAFGLRVTGPAEGDPARPVTLSYTGDTDECEGLDTLALGADLLLAEAAYVEGRDDAVRGVHLTGRRAGAAAARGGVPRLVLTHVPAWNDPGVAVREAREVYDGDVVLAEPGALHVL
ncbi:MBL fold metallo-hydrolase [Cellulomonas endophytica]|uniref:MBL fold metallo-hydrolase n=1 Tax=Cellulomonas endophytica TaxID=2494735 RepID=UPI00101393B9|nr:MBL fold metallo-hydrolase [Cellulomonas endophytica]